MKILLTTSLFPNNINKNFGNFIFQRMASFSIQTENHVNAIAPIPYCPEWVKNERWSVFRNFRRHEKIGPIEIYHPRYPLIPKIGMVFHGVFMASGILKSALQLHKRYGFDLVDGHYIYPDGLAAIIIAKILNLPVVLSARGSDINQFSKLHLIKPQIKYALKRSSAVISVCNALKTEMCELGIAEEKIDVIPNGIDVNRFVISDPPYERKFLEFTDSEKVILSVGGLIPRKGHDIVIRALLTILRIHQNCKLVIIGDGPERNNLASLAKALGLSSRVQLAGPQPNSELQRWYNAADVFCLASSREGWANVIMESMACGTPVVATNVYGAPEIITNDKVGILVERTPESIAEGLIQALNRDWDREAIRQHVAGRTWDVVAREVQGVFEKVIEGWEAGKR